MISIHFSRPNFILLIGLLSIFLANTKSTLAQTTLFEDGFSDENFTAGPAWNGADSLFTVVPAGGNPKLRLDAENDDNGDAWLSTPSTGTEGSWEFFVNLDGFSPSGSNFSYIFLMSDRADLDGAVNGYAIRAGEDGSGDRLRLVRFDNGTETTTLISGNLDISGGGGFRVRVSRDASGNWTLEEAEGYHAELNQAGSPVQDQTHSSSSHFGVRAVFSSTRADKFFYDFKITFRAEQVVRSAPDALDINFPAALDRATVDASDFSLAPDAGSIQNISYPAATDSVVRLTYTNSIPAESYTLTIDELNGSTGQQFEGPQELDFTLFDTYEAGDVVINEFMYDPPSAQAEFVELKNTSSKRLNLQNWRLQDNTTTSRTITSNPLTLQPGGFLVISSDTTELFNVYGSRNYVSMSSFPSLNNGGDQIRLFTNSDVRADSLTYEPGWGGDEVSLERVSADIEATNPANWGESPNALGGTPGQENEVAGDDTPPAVETVSIEGSRELMVKFSEALEQSSAETENNYSLTAGISISEATAVAGDSVQLNLDSDMQSNTTYTLTISGVEDLFGNAMSATEREFTYFEVVEADSGEVFINEFMADPPDDYSEYIELYNPGDEAYDLQNWTLNDNRGSRTTLTGSSRIFEPGSYVVLAPDSSLADVFTELPLLTVSGFPSLNNGGDDIVIRRGDGRLIDSLQYTGDWGGDNVALERRSIEAPATIRANWGNSPDPQFGTPGAENAIEADQAPPGLISVEAPSANKIDITFSEPVDEAAATKASNYQLDPQIGISTIQVSRSEVALFLDADLAGNTTYTVTISNISDLFGNTPANPLEDQFRYFELVPVDSGKVVINEFLYDPGEGQAEFIELYNPTNEAYSLEKWTLNDNTGNRNTITSLQKVLPPQSYLVLTPDSTLHENFPEAGLHVMGGRFPSLNNGGDAIVIRDSSGQRLDSLTYISNWGSDKSSVERLSIRVSAIYQANWKPSIAANGATPGAANSNPADTDPPALVSAIAAASNRVVLTFNEPLSPDYAPAVSAVSLTPDRDIATVDADQNTITVNLQENLASNTRYRVEIMPPIPDLFGNSVDEAVSAGFTYYDVVPVDSGSVFINEFMYDPGSEISEYIELYNPTNRAFNLAGWTLNDNTGNRKILVPRQETYILPPDTFLVIAPDSSVTGTFGEINLKVVSSSFPSLNNSGDAIVIRDSSGTLLDSLTFNSDWSLSEVAAGRRSIELPAYLKANWASSNGNFGGTPGNPNDVPADQIPPELEQFTIQSSRSLRFRFSETVKDAGLEVSISPGRTISATQFNQRNLTVQLSDPLEDGQEYTVTAGGIADIFDNPLESAVSETFTFYTSTPVDSGEVFISEFMYDPPSGYSEYVEIYNTGSNALDLRGWLINDDAGDDERITRQFLVPPGQYLVLAPDSSLIDVFGEIPLAVLDDFQTLNNTGDAIVLKDSAGQLLDSLFYTPSWQGEQVALERRSYQLSAGFRANWAASPASLLGTPGSANAIPPDESAPQLTELTFVDSTMLKLVFNEPVTASTATEAENYTITPSLPISLILHRQDTVRLRLGEAMSSGTSYTVTVSGLTDIFENRLSQAQLNVSYYRFDGAQNRDIVINEILYDGEPEFIEIYNRSERVVNLENWTMGDLSSERNLPKERPGKNTLRIQANRPLLPGEYMALTGNLNLAAQNENVLYLSGFPSLNNSSESVYIRDENGVTIDSVAYNNTAFPTEDNRSIERKDPSGASLDPANWAMSSSQQGYSAGTENTEFAPDNTAPELLFATVLPDSSIELRFNEFISLPPVEQITLGSNPVTIRQFEGTRANRMVLDPLDSGLPQEKDVRVFISNLTDVNGNSNAETSTALARPPAPGDVIINEILFDPIADDEDNQPDQAEFLEIYNRQPYAISLEGLFLHDAPDEDGEFSTLEPVSSESRWLRAGGYALVHASQAPQFEQAPAINFFDLDTLSPSHALRVDRSSLSLSSSGDAIYLSDSTGTDLDSLFFSEELHNPNLLDLDGLSLERVNPDLPTNDPSNWGTSTAELGATPARRNSLHLETQPGGDGNSITFHPNPFSPDNDGFEDRLAITYSLNEPDYLIRVRIFDRYGRHVRELANGKAAGTEGTLIWDGLNGKGNKLRVGFYIVLFEAYDSAQGKEVQFKETVVIARKI